jgi:hypothetical protein
MRTQKPRVVDDRQPPAEFDATASGSSTDAADGGESLSALDAEQAPGAPPGRYTVSPGVVYDNRTQLTWQREVAADSYSRPDAITYCSNLSLHGSSWRLPTVRELLTLYDPTRYSPSIDGNAFPNTPAETFWSSSLYAVSGGRVSAYVYPGEPWSIDFGYGFMSTYFADTALRVRCVR